MIPDNSGQVVALNNLPGNVGMLPIKDRGFKTAIRIIKTSRIRMLASL